SGPAGALGDIGTALFAVIGILAALRHRDQTGRGQHIDVAMLDSMIAMTDIVTNFWSMGLHLSASHGDPDATAMVIMDGFKANDGWFVMQVGREHQFAALMELVSAPELLADERLNNRSGWARHVNDLIRPAVERWSVNRSRVEACEALGRAGIAAGPCFAPPEVINDAHVALRHMTVELDLPETVKLPGGGPVLTPASPIKFSDIPEDDLRRVPWLGEDTDRILSEELGLSRAEIDELRVAGVVS
ncbi:MAG: CoA transferase, partial [Acidimicrobiia bacterium]